MVWFRRSIVYNLEHMNKMDLSKIKLIIWDLDEVFWKGTLSEENIFIPKEHIELINNLVDSGVMVSICSKNDEQKVFKELENNNIRDPFVFVSINWQPKGQRVKEIIGSMNLRSVNVLFIDDNVSNREEARHFSPDLNVADIDIISQLIEYFSDEKVHKDKEQKRLKQYKVLEEKNKLRMTFTSNEDFLRQSQIVLEIKNDSLNEINRIHELILRSNQLNFTKVRSSIEELKKDIEDPSSKHGYIKVHDKYGDYGIVGFYLTINDKVKHFTFSCRTLGMGIEQYIYKFLGKPKFNIVGDVSSDLNSCEPDWINNEPVLSEKTSSLTGRTVIKGPCDMAQTTLYFSGDDIITEFTYVNNKGVVIEQCNHTSVICDSIKLNQETKNALINDVDFMDKGVYDTQIFGKNISLVVFSLFTDPNLGLYKNKSNGGVIPFGEYTNNLTDEKKWPGLMDGTLFTANCVFTKEKLQKFKENYEFIGRLSPAEIIENIKFIFSHMDKKAHLCLVLGSTTPYLDNTSESYKNREDFNKVLNELAYELAKKENRIHLLDVNDFIEGQQSFTNNINHFERIVYFKMSQRLIEIAKSAGLVFKNDSKFKTFIKKYTRKLGHLFAHPISVIRGRINRRKMKKS